MTTATQPGAAEGKKIPPKRKTGRPSIYSKELAATICERLASGELLTDICATEGMPKLGTVLMWLGEGKDPAFTEAYARGRDVRVQKIGDEVLAIQDEHPETIEILDKEGKVIGVQVNGALVQWQKNRVDTRKWLLSKLAPKAYGEKTTTELTGAEGGPVQVAAAVALVAAPELEEVGRRIQERMKDGE